MRRWDNNADNGKGGTGAHIWTPTVGIDGLMMTAARDHRKDYGSVSKPEFGPEVEVSNGGSGKMKAPATASVKVFKKGIAEPTEAEVRWSEYAPADMSKAPFWKKMPYRMLGKCASALAMRQAYPDLGGLYIPEELDRSAGDYTPEGRQIVDDKGFSPSGDAVTHDARHEVSKSNQARIAERVTKETQDKIDALAKMRAEGTYCEKHRGPISKCPSDEHTPAELEAFDEIERKLKEGKKVEGKAEAEKPPIDVKPQSSPEGKKQDIPPKQEPFGTLILDLTALPHILRGDLDTDQKALDRMTPYLPTLHRKNDWWVIDPSDVHVVMAFGAKCNFKIDIIDSKDKPPVPKKPKEIAGTVKGKVSKLSDVGSTERGGQFLVVTIDKVKYTSWSKSSIPYIKDYSLGRICEFNIDKRHAIIGILKIGDTVFRDNEPIGTLT